MGHSSVFRDGGNYRSSCLLLLRGVGLARAWEIKQFDDGAVHILGYSNWIVGGIGIYRLGVDTGVDKEE